MSRSTRLIALLQALRGRRLPVTAASLAEELAVSERTIYRDLADLAAQGAPIRGEAGVGYVLGPGLFLPPLMLSEDETEAILLGLRYVDQRGDAVLRKAAATARSKVGAVLSADMQAAAVAPMLIPGPHDGVFPESPVPLESIRSAIRDRTRLAIGYVDDQERRTERVIWPILLAFTDTARVLAGWCELRQAFRFFRVDRIQAAEPQGRYPARRVELVRRFYEQVDAEQAPDRT